MAFIDVCISYLSYLKQSECDFKKVLLLFYSYMQKMNKSWGYVASPTGYITNVIFMDWFNKMFIPHSGVSSSNPVLLIMDNHESHVTFELAKTAAANNISIILQPPHSSHFLQPLDCIFKLLKDAFAATCQELGLLGKNIQVREY